VYYRRYITKKKLEKRPNSKQINQKQKKSRSIAKNPEVSKKKTSGKNQKDLDFSRSCKTAMNIFYTTKKSV